YRSNPFAKIVQRVQLGTRRDANHRRPCPTGLSNHMLTIRKAAVIGAGNMGSQIAAHLANVGIPSLLMDITPTELLPEEQKRGLTLQSPEARNRVTKPLFERATKLSPGPSFVPEVSNLIRIGN